MLYVGNDTNLEVLGLATEDGSYVTDAALTCTVSDPTGNVVATVTPAYLGTSVGAYPDGNYRGVLPGSTSLTAGTSYAMTYTASNYGLRIVHYEQAVTRVG